MFNLPNLPGAPAKLPPAKLPPPGGKSVPPRPPCRRASDDGAIAEPGDVVAVKQGGRAFAWIAAGVVMSLLCCVAFSITLGVALNNDCGAAETRCGGAPAHSQLMRAY